MPWVCVVFLGLLAGCKQDAAAQRPLTRVKAVTAELVDFAPAITLTGIIAAQVETELSFRVSGKISERLVNVGDPVVRDQVLARLDPVEQQAELESAKAGMQSAQAQLQQATASFDRQKSLLATGNTTRRDHDQAEAALRSAQAQLDQARAQLSSAEDQLSYTVLRADADGIVTARSAEAGQVVAQAQSIYAVARNGPRDAVFNVHEWALANLATDKGLPISLVSDPAVSTLGDVREISPAINPSTMTITVKIGLRQTPPGMNLGTIVNGVGAMKQRKVFLLPWGALFEIDGAPAVWLIDPSSNTVSLTPIIVDRYIQDVIAVTSGLENGQRVVTAGVQLLRPGQKVEIAAETKP
ncbi:MAG: efflux RND transporter periplasmic adaptor subunit [Reyranella sp.]|nr:efflux RND transporter periplasmic adaptor subunit [Reyranella sp.]